MRAVRPKVHIVGKSIVESNGLYNYLDEIGAPEWTTDAPSYGEALIEVGGRGCYRSFDVGLNANVTKIREGNFNYIQNIISAGHGSVLEHTSVSFIFTGVSRVFTHELVRHRVGVGISQESLRFVRLDELDFWLPTIVEENAEAKAIFLETIDYLEQQQKKLAEVYRIDTKPFKEKKEITSAMRRIAPEGLGTMIMWTANLRTIRHVIERRTDPAAEEEIRLVFAEVAALMQTHYANVFADYRKVDGPNNIPHYVTDYPKV